MTIGSAILQARKRKGWRLAGVAAEVGISEGALSNYETDKRIPDPDLLEKIAQALDSNDIRMAYLRSNPVYQSVIPRAFSDLNNIKREPAIIFTKVARECSEAKAAAEALAEMFINMDPSQAPGFVKKLRDGLEQLLDAKRSIEILETTLVEVGVLTMDGLREVYEQQQNKCVEHKHHDPAKEAKP